MFSSVILTNAELYGVWYLIGAALVFFMQAGFAMVESGFTRAKNTGNIVMKNLMDFCLGTVVFILIGAPLLIATESIGGLFGNPVGVWGNLFGNPAEYNWSGFVFNLVFCATAATIVSGSMAERTNFKAYCIYSLIISAVVYPVEAFWVWGLGENGEAISWLQKMAQNFNINGETLSYIDFAGSSCIHMVGGTTALIGAIILLLIFCFITGYYAFTLREKYNNANNNNYTEAFSNLVDYVNSVEGYLAKSMVSNTPEHAAQTLTQIWRDSNLAMVYLARIPLENDGLSQTAKFLNQVSDYSYTLSRKNIEGESLNLSLIHI